MLGLLLKCISKYFRQFKKKTKQMWVDQSSDFYNKSFKIWLEDNGIELYSTYNEEKSVVAERFI